MHDDLRGEDAEAVAAAARASSERDEIALKFAVALTPTVEARPGVPLSEIGAFLCKNAYGLADGYMAERARQRQEPLSGEPGAAEGR